MRYIDNSGRLNLFAETRAALNLSDQDAPDELALADLIGRGLPARALNVFIARGFPEAVIFQLIPSDSRLAGAAGNETLTVESSDLLERWARSLCLVQAVLGDMDRSVRWLTTPKKRFKGQRPLELIRSSMGARLLEEVLLAAYFGNVA